MLPYDQENELNHTMKLSLGIDQVNKGQVLNPIVVVACYTNTRLDQIPLIKDSKKNKTPLNFQILDSYKISYKYKEIAPETLTKGKLNQLIFQAQIALIQQIKPDVAYLDALESNTVKLIKFYKKQFPQIVFQVESRMDESNSLVAIASLIGKKIKLDNLKRLEFQVGQPVGSGNLRDPATVKYILDNYPQVKGLKPTWDLQSLGLP